MAADQRRSIALRFIRATNVPFSLSNPVMAKAIKFATVAVCLLCILAICVAPLVDLPATNLRTYQLALVLMWSLMASAFCLILSTSQLFIRVCAILFTLPRPKPLSLSLPIQTSCVLQC